MGNICNSVNDKNTLETYNLINQCHLNKSSKKEMYTRGGVEGWGEKAHNCN